MNESILLSDLNAAVVNKNRLSPVQTIGKWQVMDYELAEFKGKMLVAGENSHPEPVTIGLNVKGWHKIYLGLIRIGYGLQNGIGLKLTGESGKEYLMPDSTWVYPDGYRPWGQYEIIEQSLWKAADVTGQDFILEKPPGECTAALAFIRLIPMTAGEIKAEKEKNGAARNIMYHYDSAAFFDTGFKNPEEYAGKIERLNGAGGEFLILETSFDEGPDKSKKPPVEITRSGAEHGEMNSKYLKHKDEVHRALVARTHEYGIKLLVGRRIELADFHIIHNNTFNAGDAEKYPRYRCMTRDGRHTAILSYAYPEARKISVERFLPALRNGFDGVSLFFHRGTFVMFEQPVIDEVKAKYGADARELPIADPRLHEVWCGFLTEYLREFRAALDKLGEETGVKRYHINAILLLDSPHSRHIGADIETWAKEGLIDSFCQSRMMVYEDLCGCMSDVDPSLIDIEKFKKVNGERAVWKRDHSDYSAETLTEGTSSFLPVSREYGIPYYAALRWDTEPPERQMEIAKAQYRAGAEKLLCWNAVGITPSAAKWETIRYLADRDGVLGGKHLPELPKRHRVLSIGGVDISTADPNWRG
jgi:hypothetical protein